MDITEITNRVFAKLGEEKQLREYHQIIYKLLGVVIDFINADGVSLKLSRGQYFNPFCVRLRQSEEGLQLCAACDRDNARCAAARGKPMRYTCHAGFVEILVPLFGQGGHYIGSMTAGQFHQEGQAFPSREEIASLVRPMGLDPEEMYSLRQQTLTLTACQIEGLTEFLEAIGRLLVSTHNHLMFMESVNAPDKIELIKKYVEENYRKPLTIALLAKKFYLSPGYFCHYFRHATGIGFNAYLNFFRISKAREMLTETELSISEIAFLCGFGSISQFNRIFRSVTNDNPRALRKKDRPDA